MGDKLGVLVGPDPDLYENVLRYPQTNQAMMTTNSRITREQVNAAQISKTPA